MNGELPRVRLRAMEPEDLDILYRIENDMSLWDVGNTNVPYSRYALHDYIAHASHDIYAVRSVSKGRWYYPHPTETYHFLSYTGYPNLPVP